MVTSKYINILYDSYGKRNRKAMKKNEKCFCPLTHTLGIIGGKWKILVLGQLVSNTTMRYKEIERAISPITPRVLIKVLKDLEDDELVTRKVYPEVPPRVEYSITELGKSLIPIVKEIKTWGNYHQSKIVNKKKKVKMEDCDVEPKPSHASTVTL